MTTKKFYKIDLRKVVDDGYSSTPRIEFFDKSGNDVTPLPLYVPEANVVATVEKHRMK